MPRRTATLGGNAAITLAAQFAILVLGLVVSALVARALGPTGRGRYYVPVTTVMTTFSVLHLSLEMATTYFFAERLVDLRRLARVAATYGLVIGGAGLVVLAGPWIVAPDGRVGGMRTGDLALAALALPFVVHSTWMMNLFVLGGRLVRSQAAVVLAGVVQAAALAVLFALDVLGVTEVLLVYVLNAAVSWGFLAWWSRGFAPPVPTGDRPLLRRVAAYGLRIHPGFVAFFLLLRSDVFLVDGLLGTREVGIYSVAVLFAELVGTAAAPMAVAALPFQSVEDEEAAAAVTLRTARICLLVAAALSVLAAATLWLVIPALYGPAFGEAYGPLVALLPGVCAMTVVRPLWNWLLREGRPGRITAIAAGAFALNLALNAVLLPTVGLYGASVASTLAYGALATGLGAWAVRVAGARPSALLPGRDELAAARRGLAAARGAVASRLGRSAS
ncbi:oligosaccharide flippase family protein [Patulibacter sp. SYSU D01012]|uniref:lipopolysaccharide biosynthesis protein n=1 Tax=Patulibacter sp. SYSU D01012 TaxID=2817381 RepID=UPI001B305A47|nr:oligosaccharide flippase family protein [Patulibacter sp. SYSU D01012]